MPDEISPVELVRRLQELRERRAATEGRLVALQAEKTADAAHWRRLVAIVEGTREAIWSWNLERIIDSWNGEAERLFQYRADEIIGRSLFLLVPPERMERARTAFASLLMGGWYDQ